MKENKSASASPITMDRKRREGGGSAMGRQFPVLKVGRVLSGRFLVFHIFITRRLRNGWQINWR